MKAIIINIETLLLKDNYYISHISYLVYDFTNLKLLIIHNHDIEIYHKAHKLYNNNNNTSNQNYILSNNKIKRIIAIINYYIKLVDIIIAYDYNFLKKVFIEECNRNKIFCEIESYNHYCVLEVYNKIFYKFDLSKNTKIQNNKLYIIYQELFQLSYLFNITHTLLNCLLIIRIYYKFVIGNDLEIYDYNIKRLRIYNS